MKNAAKERSREIIDGYTEFEQGQGCTGLCYGKVSADGSISGLCGKISDNCEQVVEYLGATEGDLILYASRNSGAVNSVLGRLPVKIGHERGLIRDGLKFAFCWVVDFPLFEFDEEEGRYRGSAL